MIAVAVMCMADGCWCLELEHEAVPYCVKIQEAVSTVSALRWMRPVNRTKSPSHDRTSTKNPPPSKHFMYIGTLLPSRALQLDHISAAVRRRNGLREKLVRMKRLDSRDGFGDRSSTIV
ncbi:hypothetical protein BZA05DRAFT_396279 [Tricharina praecox]|uniref:uncharacterized protein n=1 Tax=Tricharina praecox TaxID=43433 RepID=UPI00221F4A7F|nr:uncharacterized protein BZA05DRAFT_396279 [Tricharina praecox]KAI5853499.1 hypothetical protein BZA05DRAFT_396279 [Tricharina praecox]